MNNLERERIEAGLTALVLALILLGAIVAPVWAMFS